MAPSPRKTAPSTFDPKWHETDAALFDPASLPLSKVPRAWERKSETTKSRDGKQKKVFRRYTLRSRVTDTTSQADDEQEEHDSRSRPVKKLQRMSPDAMENMAAMPMAKKRAFKATRWDRRKSFLPRKKTVRQDPSVNSVVEQNDADESTLGAADTTNDSISEWDMIGEEQQQQEEEEEEKEKEVVSTLASLADGDKRRSMFTFTVDGQHDHFPGRKLSTSPEPSEEYTRAPSEFGVEQDGTFHFLFRSPSKGASPTKGVHFSADTNTFPLPKPDDMETLHSDAPDPMEEEDHPSLSVHLEAPILSTTVVGDEELGDTSPQDNCSELEEFPMADQSETEQDIEMSTAAATDVSEPLLDEEVPSTAPNDSPVHLVEAEDTNMSETTFGLNDTFSPQKQINFNEGGVESPALSPQEDTTLTEASLPLDIQRDIGMPLPEEKLGTSVLPDEYEEAIDDDVITSEHGTVENVATSPDHENETAESETTSEPLADEMADGIADGLTFSFPMPSSVEPTPRKLQPPSPSPVESGPDDATTTLALDDDTALLKDFLTRAAASKANKAANIARRTSLQNRRDSGAVRHALASPRKILEDKDPNSPSKYDNDTTLDLTQTITLNIDQQPPLSPTPDQADAEGMEDAKPLRSSRRSTRNRKSRLPAPSSTPQQTQTPKNIAVRRVDGSEPIVLKRTEAQELGLLTRANTRKNKQGAFGVSVTLLKLSTEAVSLPPADDNTKVSTTEAAPGKKNVRWDETLAYFQEGTDTVANMIADAESLATPDELSLPLSTPSSKPKVKVTKDKNSTPKIRRVRGLGAANGTPGKGLLTPASMLPDGVLEEKEEPATQPPRLPKPKTSRVKKMHVALSSTDKAPTSIPSDSQLPSLELAPVGIELVKDTKAAKERKSRLATPKRAKLSQPVSAVPVEGKENQQGRGIGGATPKKGLPTPQVIVPPVMETGLPRRRGRRV